MKFKPEMTVDELSDKVPWSSQPVWEGCTVGQGWVKLISRLIDDMNETDCTYVVAQVKEKFGGLRFYYDPVEHAEGCNGGDDWSACPLAQLVSRAEAKSYETCEKCGRKADPQDDDSVKFGRWGSYCKQCK